MQCARYQLYNSQTLIFFQCTYCIKHIEHHVQACSHDAISCTQLLSNYLIRKSSLWLQHNSTKESYDTNRIAWTSLMYNNLSFHVTLLWCIVIIWIMMAGFKCKKFSINPPTSVPVKSSYYMPLQTNEISQTTASCLKSVIKACYRAMKSPNLCQ